MNGELNAPQTLTHVLDSHIKSLDIDELDAILRSDWSAARNVSLARAPLKEARQRTGVPKRRRA
jgi:hypothetical protein